MVNLRSDYNRDTNKGTAAKQEAFEEAAKLKHQFRSLDEDDVSFLNGIRESEAAKEREVQKQTLDQLEAFRKQQEVSAAATDSDPTADPDATLVENGITWTVPTKKRKRETVKGLKGVKSVKTAASTDEEVTEPKTEAVTSKKSDTKDGVETVAIDRVDVAQATKAGPKVMAPSALFVAASDNVGAPKAGPILGLGDYSSDED